MLLLSADFFPKLTFQKNLSIFRNSVRVPNDLDPDQEEVVIHTVASMKKLLKSS